MRRLFTVQIKIRGSSVVIGPEQHILSSCAKNGIIFNFYWLNRMKFHGPPPDCIPMGAENE